MTLKSAQNNKYLQPGKEKELADLVNQLSVLTKQVEYQKKLLSSQSKGTAVDRNLPRLSQLSRDVSTSANKLKIFILNRKNLDS